MSGVNDLPADGQNRPLAQSHLEHTLIPAWGQLDKMIDKQRPMK